ncbi:MAG: AEC family transporter [Oscillospiraceae bacterium]|nr:AEC family transporter [Oscillospiraceae bacterium]
MDGSVFLVSEKVITLFIVLFIGVIARKFNIIDWDATKKLSAFLLNVTQPLMIITSFQMDFDSEKLKNGLMIIALSVSIHIFSAAAAFLLYKPVKDGGKRKVYEMGTIFCNCAFLGYPVLKVIFGDETGVFYGAFYTMFFNIFIWTYGVVLITRQENKDNKNIEDKNKTKNKLPVSKIFLNSGMIASVIGIIIFISGIKLPGVLYDSSKLVGDMTFPLSMIIIGSLISNINLKDMFLSVRNYYYIFIKLIFIPGLTGFICYILKLPAVIIYMGTIMTALPSAANVAIFAETYEADSKAGAINVGLSTLISIGTIPLAIYFLDNILKVKI